jgi:2-methylcitrate dehydratase PrpD
LEDLAPAAIREPGTRALMARVDSRVADDLSSDDMRRRYPESARVTLTLRDGRRLHGFCGAAYGMPERPLSDRDLLAKFDRCVRYSGCPESASEAASGLLKSFGEASGRAGLGAIAALLAASRDAGS